MSINNFVAQNVFLPFSDLLTHKKVSYYLKFLSGSQYWSQDKLLQYQNERLAKMVHYAYNHFPFYRELYDRHGVKLSQVQSVDDLHLLPIVTKNDFRKATKSGGLSNPALDYQKMERNRSSGSTGEPLEFYLSLDASSIKKASAIRAWQWMDFNLGDKILRISPLPRGGLLKKIQDVFANTIYMQSIRSNEAEFGLMFELLTKHKPLILRGYPDPLFLFAKYLKEHKLVPPPLRAINTTGSTLHKQYRETIEEVFSCRVFDSFSCEGGAVASQCSKNSLYHVADEYAVTEIVDSEGNKSNKGRLITTDLWNTATPFIRYDTQDHVEKSDERCSCGRGLSSIKHIFGRSADILVTPQGQYLFANSFTGHFQNIVEINQYQIHQTEADKLIVRVVPNDAYSKNTEAKILAIMANIVGNDMTITVETVNEIPLLASGKRRFLVRDESIRV